MEENIFSFEKLPVITATIDAKLDNLIKRFDMIFGKENIINNGHELLDMKAASKMIGKAESTLYNMTSSGIIPYHKKGNKLYFFKDELLKWIENDTHSSCNDIDTFDKHLCKLQQEKKRKSTNFD